MDFESCFNTSPAILMEGAIGERLKREYNIVFDKNVAMAGLIYDTHAREAMAAVFNEYEAVAGKYCLPFIATTPTRRANKDNVKMSGFSGKIIEDNVSFLKHIKDSSNTQMFIGGLMGCKGDAYKATDVLDADEARDFHSWQAGLFKEAGVDLLYAGIMPALTEAAGMARAMEETGLPYIISFMIRSNGRLIDGTTINDAISSIDNFTSRKPLCYMTNCIHPKILAEALSWEFNETEPVRERFKGIQANASPLSPEKLDNCCDLKSSDSIALADDMMALYRRISPKILGGCCGTDNTHMEAIARRLSNLKENANEF